MTDDPDGPAATAVVRRAMVARIATASRSGRPSVNPLYFVCVRGRIWLGTVDWTLAARNVRADDRVTLLFDVERDPSDRRVVRMTGRARLRTDPRTVRAYAWRAARRYVLSPAGLVDALAHRRSLRLRRRYHAQSSARGRSCVIDVVPERMELLEAP